MIISNSRVLNYLYNYFIVKSIFNLTKLVHPGRYLAMLLLFQKSVRKVDFSQKATNVYNSWLIGVFILFAFLLNTVCSRKSLKTSGFGKTWRKLFSGAFLQYFKILILFVHPKIHQFPWSIAPFNYAVFCLKFSYRYIGIVTGFFGHSHYA